MRGLRKVDHLEGLKKIKNNAGSRNSVQNSFDAVNSLEHVETRKLRQETQFITVDNSGWVTHRHRHFCGQSRELKALCELI